MAELGPGGADQLEIPPRRNLLGVGLSVVDKETIQRLVTAAVALRKPLSVTFLNPTYLIAAQRDDELRGFINSFDVVLADGWGVVYGARFLGIAIPTRLANDDIGPDLFRESQRLGWRTFLFGSAPGIAQQAGENLVRLLPGLPIVGTRHGWWDVERGHPGRFAVSDELDAVAAINASRADVVWVGIPTPLQQRWVATYRDQLEAPVVITGGAYLDHLTESLDGYYPAWAMRFHLCWLYKLALEPRRLWRRYTIEMAEFGWLLLRARLERRSVVGD